MQILEQNQCVSLKSLALTGNDLIALGIPKGKEIGIVLNELLEDVIAQPEHNNREYLIQLNRKALMTAQVMLTMITYCLTVAHESLQIPIWQDLMQMSLNSHEMKFMPEQDEDSIRTTYKIILTINGGMWERLNPKISPRICSMMLKSIMLISLEIMRKNMLSSI